MPAGLLGANSQAGQVPILLLPCWLSSMSGARTGNWPVFGRSSSFCMGWLSVGVLRACADQGHATTQFARHVNTLFDCIASGSALMPHNCLAGPSSLPVGFACSVWHVSHSSIALQRVCMRFSARLHVQIGLTALANRKSTSQLTVHMSTCCIMLYTL